MGRHYGGYIIPAFPGPMAGIYQHGDITTTFWGRHSGEIHGAHISRWLHNPCILGILKEQRYQNGSITPTFSGAMVGRNQYGHVTSAGLHDPKAYGRIIPTFSPPPPGLWSDKCGNTTTRWLK